MPSFFTDPASERKRKRPAKAPTPSKRRKDDTIHKRGKNARMSSLSKRDESISGSDSENAQSADNGSDQDTNTSASEHEHETGAERRLRLAERYLQSLRKEVDETEFDAADLDRDLIAERLKEDVSESKGRLYRYIASTYEFSTAATVQLRSSDNSTTCVAAHAPYIYTATKNMAITKWRLPGSTDVLSGPTGSQQPSKTPPSSRRRPVCVKTVRGIHKTTSGTDVQHHSGPILCLAISPDGRFLATGGADKRLIIWSAETMQALRVFSQHRDAVLAVAFRRATNQLYSGSADRTIKTWSLNELAYVETLFGHQDAVVDVAALAQERCISAGARDRTVRLWKVVEETQLVFRSGGAAGERLGGKSKSQPEEETKDSSTGAEGSVERVAFIDEESFISGSDNGTLSLWSLHKKKPIFSIPAAHGFDPPPEPEDYFAEMDPTGRAVPIGPEPRWITALAAVPYSDLVLSGSWDGHVRAWKVSPDKKRIEAIGTVGTLEGCQQAENPEGVAFCGKGVSSGPPNCPARGVVNDIAVFEQGDRGKEILLVAIALGKEHRLGRWKKVGGRNGGAIFEICKKAA